MRVLSTVYVMYHCCCLTTMLRAGLVNSICHVPLSFMWVLSTVCHVPLLLSGDHASCGSCQQYNVMYHCCCLATMLHAGLVNSICHVPLLLSGDHASCGSCRQCMSCIIVAVWRPCFVQVLSTVHVIYYCDSNIACLVTNGIMPV